MDFLHTQHSPGATACIVIGRWHADLSLPEPSQRTVLWFVDSAGLEPAPPGAITVRQVSGDATDALDDFLHQSPKTLPALYITPGLPHQHTAGYAAAIDTVGVALEAHRRARVTRQQDAFAWQHHLYKNLPDYAARRVPASWENALTGLPAVVCGAGPSLDKSIDALARAVAAGAVVFAADSAWRMLSQRGIPTDFIVSVDLAKTPDRCVPPIGIAHQRVILAATSPPAWSDAVPGESRFYVAGPHLTLDWLESRGVARPPVAVCENCGATALMLARFLGCAPIHLFGLDLALDDAEPARRHHAGVDASLYERSGFNPAQEFPRVPGNFAATVPTHALGDWRALNRRLATWPADLVVAITDRGARLTNVPAVRPEAFRPTFHAPSHRAARLAKLAKPIFVPVETQKCIADVLAVFGARLSAVTDFLHGADVPTIVSALRVLLQEPDVGHLLGAYALKLLPHVLPPIDADPVFWRTILEEIAALAQAAENAATTP